MKGWDLTSVRKAASRGLKVEATDGGGLDLLLPTAPSAEVPAKRNKFGNVATVIDGHRFASKLEGTRYLQLKMLKAGGMVTEFYCQQTFTLEVNGLHICRYIADFEVHWSDGRVTIEDTKGVETPDFKIKKKLMLAIHGIEVELITNNSNNNGKSKATSSG